MVTPRRNVFLWTCHLCDTGARWSPVYQFPHVINEHLHWRHHA